MWAQTYATGDEYSRDKALTALDEILPKARKARVSALETLRPMLSPNQYLLLVRQLVPAE
jgi:hypothetical protein